MSAKTCIIDTITNKWDARDLQEAYEDLLTVNENPTQADLELLIKKQIREVIKEQHVLARAVNEIPGQQMLLTSITSVIGSEATNTVGKFNLPRSLDPNAPERTRIREAADKSGRTYQIVMAALKVNSIEDLAQMIKNYNGAKNIFEDIGIDFTHPTNSAWELSVNQNNKRIHEGLKHLMDSLNIDITSDKWKNQFHKTEFRLGDHLVNSAVGAVTKNVLPHFPMWKGVKPKNPSFLSRISNILSNPNTDKILRTEYGLSDREISLFNNIKKLSKELFSSTKLKQLTDTKFFNSSLVFSPITGLLTFSEDQVRGLDENVAMALTIAAVEWLDINAKSLMYTPEENIKSMFGKDSRDELNPDAGIIISRFGDLRKNITRDIGRNAFDMLGIAPTKKAADIIPDLADKMQESLGLLAIEMMSRNDMLTYIRANADSLGQLLGDTSFEGQDTIFIRPKAKNEDIQSPEYLDLADPLQKMLNDWTSAGIRDFLKKIKDKVEDKSIKVTPTPESKQVSIIKKTGQLVTSLGKQVVARYSAMPFSVDKKALEVFKAIDRDTWLKQHGWKTPEQLKSVMDVNLPSIKGKNLSLELEYDAAIEFIEKLEQTENGLDTEFFFDWTIAKNSRINMIANIVNPQSLKLHRHLFKPKEQINTTVKLNLENIREYKIAIAAAFGVSHDKQQDSLTLKEYDEIRESDLVSKIITSFKAGHIDTASLAEAISKYEEPSILDGIAAIVELENATENNRDIELNLGIETDATTSGLFIGLLQFSTELNEQTTNQLAAGGIHFDGTESQVEWGERVVNGVQNVDNYKAMILRMIDTLREGPDYHVLDRFIKELFVSENVDDGNGGVETRFLVTPEGRNFAKNPTTIFNYGASATKIISNATKTLVSDFYKDLQKLIDADNQENLETEVKNLQMHINGVIQEGMNLPLEENEKPINAELVTIPTNEKLLDFKLSKDQFKAIAKYFGATYGNALVTSIEESYPDIKAAKDSILMINNFITVNYRMRFENAYANALEEKVKSYKKEGLNIFLANLNKEDIAKIKESIKKYAPIYATPTSTSLDNGVFAIKYGKSPMNRLDLIIQYARSNNLLNKEHSKMSDKDLYDVISRSQDVTNVGLEYSEPLPNTYAFNSKYDANEDIDMVLHKQKGSSSEKITAIFEYPIDAGASVMTDLVQGVEAHHIQTVMLMHYLMGIHDAEVTHIAQTAEAVKAHNQAVADINSKYSVAEAVLDTFNRINKTEDLFSMQEKEELSKAVNTLREIATRNKEVKKRIFSPGKGFATHITHVVKNGIVIRVGQETDPSMLGSEEASFDGVNNFSPNTTEKLTARNAVDIFNRLRNLGNKTDSSEHRNHLQTLMVKIARAMDASQEFWLNLEQKSEREKDKTLGGFSKSRNSIDIKIADTNSGLLSSLNMSAQETFAHEHTHAVVQFGLANSPYLRKEALKLYNAAKKQLSYVDLLVRDANGNVITTHATYAEEVAAAKKLYDYMFNPSNTNVITDRGLQEFIALGNTNEQVRKALATVTMNKKDSKDTLERRILNWLVKAINFLSGAYFKLDRNNAADRLTSITIQMIKVNNQHESYLQKVTKKIDDLNPPITNFVVNKIFEPLDKYGAKGGTLPRRVVGTITGIPRFATSPQFAVIMNSVFRNFDDLTLGSMQSVVNLLKNIPYELLGRTATNEDYLNLLSKSINEIDSAKERMKTVATETFNEAFHTKLTEAENISLYHGLLKTDLIDLQDKFSLPQIKRLMTDEDYLNQKIEEAKESLTRYGDNATAFDKQADSLGHYIATLVATANNAMLNPYNIAHGFYARPGTFTPLQNVDQAEKDISILKSLYAIKYTDQTHKNVTADIIQKERDVNIHDNGIIGFFNMHKYHREQSLDRLFEGQKALMTSGYHTETHNPNVDIKFSSSNNDRGLISEHYVLVGPVSGDPHSSGHRGFMYVNKSGGLMPYVKTIVSLTSRNALGTDLEDIAARQGSTDPYQDARLELDSIKSAKYAAIENNESTDPDKPQIVPVVDHNGNIVNYRYIMSEANRIEFLDKETRLDHVIGNMYMRNTDKEHTIEINNETADLIWEDYRENYLEDPDAFVEISARSENEKYREIYSLMPDSLRERLKHNFNGNVFYIRRNEMNIIFGFRKKSISNLEMFKHIKPMVRFVERFVHAIVGKAAFNIVMKTTVLPNNIISNTLSGFIAAGVPLDYMIKQQINASIALEDFLKQRHTYEKLKFKLDTHKHLTLSTKDKIKSQMKILKGELDNNIVKTLIDENLLSSIIEDISLENISDKYNPLEQLRSKLEEKIGIDKSGIGKTTYDYAYWTKDTKLLQLLVTATQYSDFAARYAMYSWIMKGAEGMSEADRAKLHKDAIYRVKDTFIDYNMPTSPEMQWLNDTGFMVFTKYQFRIQRVILKTMKERLANLMAMHFSMEMSGTHLSNITDSFIPDGNLTNTLSFGSNAMMMPGLDLVGAALP